MKRTIIILIIISLWAFTSFSREINIAKYIDITSHLTLTAYKTNDQTSLTESETCKIEPNSEKFKKLIEWGNNNQDKWESTPASYITKIALSQKDFHLLYNQDYVVIGFKDNKGKAQQYTRAVKKGELAFLTDITWSTFRDTININDGLIMIFNYPDNLVAGGIENGRCIGKPKYPEGSDDAVTNSMRWCVWMTDLTESAPIDSLISSEKYFFKGQVTELRDTIIISDTKAMRVTFKSNNRNDPYRQIIILKKYSTLFEIINNYSADKDFEKFCNSLKLTKTSGHSR